MSRSEMARVLQDAADHAKLAAEAVLNGDDDEALACCIAAHAALELVATKLPRQP